MLSLLNLIRQTHLTDGCPISRTPFVREVGFHKWRLLWMVSADLRLADRATFAKVVTNGYGQGAYVRSRR